MFESRRDPLLSRRRFARRMVGFAIAAVGVDFAAVLLGAVGYHAVEGIGWVDALVDSALIITGNGPITALSTPVGRLFAAFDALFGGIVFVVVAAVLLSPVFHRVLHSFHLEPEESRSPRG